MAGTISYLSELVHLLRPGVAQIFDREWRKLRPRRRPIEWHMDVDYVSDNVVFGISRKVMVLVNRHELDDRSYRDVCMPRLEHWLRKNLPRPHVRYVAKDFIKRQFRRPSVRID